MKYLLYFKFTHTICFAVHSTFLSFCLNKTMSATNFSNHLSPCTMNGSRHCIRIGAVTSDRIQALRWYLQRTKRQHNADFLNSIDSVLIIIFFTGTRQASQLVCSWTVFERCLLRKADTNKLSHSHLPDLRAGHDRACDTRARAGRRSLQEPLLRPHCWHQQSPIFQ